MASRTAKIALSIVAGILAGAPLIMPRDAAKAAECLTEPGKDSTRGQHWYYRIEHGTKRHCWYLRGENETVSQSEPSDDSAQAPKAEPRNNESTPRSIEDAHAEYLMPQARGNAVAAPAPSPAAGPAASPAPIPAPVASNPVPPSAQPDAQGSAVAARWPSPETATSPSAAAAAAAPQAMADATVSQPAADTAADAPADPPAPAPAAAASTPPVKPSASLQMLFLVIGGALALAGLTASVVYRLGRRKQRRLATQERRAVLWEGVETGPAPPWIEPVVEPFMEEAAPRPKAERRAPPSAKTQERYEKIEEILAQLVKQAQQSDA
ncbi:hypothetical protein [Bradyrhizobium sp. Tv2a-2]|uniref:hypothetical protein n=1 Tax=Bradyrhizobium sp. Tv2a-2 TaxID=113395 RepID=UPI000416B335|nr:hypothetical protein [Bradyrhizobium sp. Tv2a-2]